MPQSKISPNDMAERQRVQALDNLSLLDTPPEQNFDDIVLLATRLCDTPVALVSLVTDDRQWFKARLGFNACETTLDRSVCRHAMHADGLFIIPDLTKDARTRTNPLVIGDPGIRFYAGAPLHTHDGIPIGALCVIDTKPRPAGLSDEQQQCLLALARQVCALIESKRHYNMLVDRKDAEHQATTLALVDERLTGGRREEFVAVLGHDLRNPLGAISSALEILDLDKTGNFLPRILPVMKASCLRMDELINNMLDLARSRLGGGIRADLSSEASLEPFLRQVTTELMAAYPDRDVTLDFSIDKPVHCDRNRISQLYSNLLGNALKHGSADATVTVTAETKNDEFVLSVSNGGAPIPPAYIDRLFLPYTQGGNERSGLGLGLYIANGIAQAHNGTLNVVSDVEKTCFTFHMPLVTGKA